MSSTQEIEKYFSDPLNFPLAYKTWLVTWLQDNLVSFPASNLVGATFIPTAMVLDFAGTTPPGGFLICDGAQYPQGQYSALFSQIGTTYNTGGETAGYFRVPACQGRLSVGLNTSVTALNAIGKTDGFSLASREPFHFHLKPALSGSPGTLTGSPGLTGSPSISDPGHNHSISPDVDVFNHAAASGVYGAAGGDRNIIDLTTTDGGGTKTTGITVGIGTLAATAGTLAVGTGTLALATDIGVTSAGQDTPAFIVLLKIIKY